MYCAPLPPRPPGSGIGCDACWWDSPPGLSGLSPASVVPPRGALSPMQLSFPSGDAFWRPGPAESRLRAQLPGLSPLGPLCKPRQICPICLPAYHSHAQFLAVIGSLFPLDLQARGRRFRLPKPPPIPHPRLQDRQITKRTQKWGILPPDESPKNRRRTPLPPAKPAPHSPGRSSLRPLRGLGVLDVK